VGGTSDSESGSSAASVSSSVASEADVGMLEGGLAGSIRHDPTIDAEALSREWVALRLNLPSTEPSSSYPPGV
jgi:hypothetical protein